MHKSVDKAQVVPPAARPRLVCGCGIPLGRFTPPGGTVGELRLCPVCDFSPSLTNRDAA